MGYTIVNNVTAQSFIVNDTVPSDLSDSAYADGLVFTTVAERDESTRISRDAGLDEGRRLGRMGVRNGIIEYFRDVLGDTSSLNHILEHLGMDPHVNKYRVTALVEGEEVLTVIVEADDEEKAESMVEEGFQQVDTEVEVDFDYAGPGEIEDSITYSYDYGNLSDFLTFEFTVEEYYE